MYFFTEAQVAAAAAAAKRSDFDPLAKQFAKLASKAKPGKVIRKPGELRKRMSASTLSMPSVGESGEDAKGCLLTDHGVFYGLRTWRHA